MAERFQYQYQPITGPVWREPVAEKLAWLPGGQQPGRRIPPNRVGDFQQPSYDALFHPEGLQWQPSDRYAGRPVAYSLQRFYVLDPIPPANPRLLDWQAQDRYYGRQPARARLDWSVYPPQVIVPAFDPQDLEWIPQGAFPRVLVELRKLGDFVQPPFDALFRSEGLQWQPSDRYAGRARPRPSPFDWSVYPLQIIQAPFDPQNLEWIPQGTYPRIPVEFRRLGDVWAPIYQALYRPENLEWLLQGQQPSRTIPFIWQGGWIIDPIPQPDVAPPNLHRMYFDVSSGRLFWRVSQTANPIEIMPL